MWWGGGRSPPPLCDPGSVIIPLLISTGRERKKSTARIVNGMKKKRKMWFIMVAQTWMVHANYSVPPPGGSAGSKNHGQPESQTPGTRKHVIMINLSILRKHSM